MRRSGWVAVLAVVGLALTGCSDPGTPADTLPTAASTSAESTLAPLGPADFPVPAEAREQTAEGAAAMATYYFDLLTYTQRIPTGEPLRSFTKDCADCDSIADSQTQDGDVGISIQGGEFVVASAAGQLEADGSANVGVRVDRSASVVRDAAGNEIAARSGSAATLSGGVLLTWEPQRSVWLVTQIDLEAV